MVDGKQKIENSVPLKAMLGALAMLLFTLLHFNRLSLIDSASFVPVWERAVHSIYSACH